MVYAGDLWVQLPVRDLYDTLMMAMAINAARDMYNRGEKKLDDFYEKYNDFTSPILKDMDAYNNIIGGVKDTINNIYARGGDPLRNAQDRAEMMAAIRNVPVGDINRLRLSAETAKEYIKNRGVLEAKGIYNPDFEERYLGWDLNNWDSLDPKKGVWNRISPAEFKTLKEATNDWYNDRTPGQLTKEQVEAFGVNYDPRYTYTGFGDDQLMNIARNNTPGWLNSIWSNYYRDIAKQQVEARGEEVTPEAIENQLQRNIADAQQEWLITPTKKADEFEIIAQKHRNDVALENLSHRHAMDRQAASHGGKGKGDLMVPVIFREAAARPGVEVNYAVDQNPHYQWMDPLLQGARVVKGKKGNYAYNIPASLTAFIYKKNDRNFDGSRISARFDYGFSGSDATFIPTGQMRMELDFKGNPHYYITGTLANNASGVEAGSGSLDGTELYEMEVTERAFNYGQKQKSAYYPTN